METSELKSQLLRLIDQLNDPVLLDEYYEEIQKVVDSSKSKLWDTLTEDQRREVLIAAKECEDEKNLVSNSEVMNRYKQWLTP